MMENFSNYTRVDPNNHISITSLRVTGNTINKNESCYVYKEKRVDYFTGDFTHLFTIKTMTSGVLGSQVYLYGLTNTIDTANHWVNHSIAVINYCDGDCTSLLLYRLGYPVAASIEDVPFDTVYYCKLTRVSNTYTLYVYTDADRTNLLDSITRTDSNPISARCIYALSSYGSGSERPCYGAYIEELNIGEVESGKFELPATGIYGYDYEGKEYIKCKVDSEGVLSTS